MIIVEKRKICFNIWFGGGSQARSADDDDGEADAAPSMFQEPAAILSLLARSFSGNLLFGTFTLSTLFRTLSSSRSSPSSPTTALRPLLWGSSSGPWRSSALSPPAQKEKVKQAWGENWNPEKNGSMEKCWKIRRRRKTEEFLKNFWVLHLKSFCTEIWLHLLEFLRTRILWSQLHKTALISLSRFKCHINTDGHFALSIDFTYIYTRKEKGKLRVCIWQVKRFVRNTAI